MERVYFRESVWVRTKGHSGSVQRATKGKRRLDVTNNPNVHTGASSTHTRVNKSVDGRRNVTACHRIYLVNSSAKHHKHPFFLVSFPSPDIQSVCVVTKSSKHPSCHDATNTHKHRLKTVSTCPGVIVENWVSEALHPGRSFQKSVFGDLRCCLRVHWRLKCIQKAQF